MAGGDFFLAVVDWRQISGFHGAIALRCSSAAAAIVQN
jgi:hypothetical protein